MFIVGSWRNLRSGMQRRATQRRARRLAQPHATSSNVQVTAPSPMELPVGATNALPEPMTMPLPIEQRDILIRTGGQELTMAEIQAAQAQQSQRRGLLGRFRRRGNTTTQPVHQDGVSIGDVAAGVATVAAGTLMNNPNQATATNMNLQSAQATDPYTEDWMDSTAYDNPQTVSSTQTQVGLPAQNTQTYNETGFPTVSPGENGDVIEDYEEELTQTRELRLNEIRQQASSSHATPTATPSQTNGDHVHITKDDLVTATNITQTQAASAAQDVPISKPVTNQTKPKRDWRLPDYRTLLSSGSSQNVNREYLIKQAKVIEDTLTGFGAPGKVVEVNTGPVITQYGVEPDYLTSKSGKKSRVKVGAIAQLDRDLQLALGAKSIRVEAPVPGKGYVGVEVPNEIPAMVSLRDVMESDVFRNISNKSPLAIALGQGVDGSPVAADLTTMPHLLIAGTTGSGKSVCVNSIIASIITLNTPEQVKLVMVDPKRVELTGYNGIPHLIAPVVVELEKTISVLKWVTREMDERYKRFSQNGARNITDFNNKRPATEEHMPYIVVIVDELADLMMMAPEETERYISRVAALARATGIHLVIATQRPSVDVVTGLIKANFPARIAFNVAGGVDSRVIIDQPGAEKLLGKGDMLYVSGHSPAPFRLQGVFVSDTEINNIVRYWKMQGLEQPTRDTVVFESQTRQGQGTPNNNANGEQVGFWDEYEGAGHTGFSQGSVDSDDDPLYQKSVDLVRRQQKASVSMLQRRLKIGYNRAARIIDMMEERGVVGPAKEGSSKPRDVLPIT